MPAPIETAEASSAVTPELAARLRLAIARVARRLRQEAGTDLGPAQTAALATIERHGPLTPSEVAQRERIKRPTATRLVASLVDLGLVERAPHPSDGRGSLLTATSEGRSLLRRLRARKTAYLAQQLRDLSPADAAALARTAEVLERMLEEDPTTEQPIRREAQ
jgi:DNA-binding MarR family transcriptional regulator